MEYLFPSTHFLSLCVPKSEVGVLQTAYIRVLFLYPFSLFLLVGAFNSFTFWVIIDMYIFISILLIVLHLFLWVFLGFNNFL